MITLKGLLTPLALIGLVLQLLAARWLPSEDALAFGLGFLLSAVNYALLASLMRRLLAGAVSGSSRGLLSLISGLKFFGLVGVLYLLLVHYRLSGIFLAAGALLSIVILSGLLYKRYMRTLNVSRQS